MYLVNEVLKYLKVFLLGMFSAASLIHIHGWPPPSDIWGLQITRQVARRASCDVSGTSDILQP